MKMFIAMPFSADYEAVHSAISEAAGEAGLTPVRGDEIPGPGIVMDQVHAEIADSDFVLAEVSDGNPNVFYEVGLAHCRKLPTLLLASRKAAKDLAFDVRHHRVVTYDASRPELLVKPLSDQFRFLKTILSGDAGPPDLKQYFGSLGSFERNPEVVIEEYVERIGKEFHMSFPRLAEERYSDSEGYVLTIVDSFHERVVFAVDINGNVSRKKRIT